MSEGDQNVVRSGTEFLFTFGIIAIALGVLGAIGYISAFDWETYNNMSGYTTSLESDMMKPDIASMFIKSGVSLFGGTFIGVFFIAVDRIALTLKKIQLGIKHDPERKENKSETDEDKGYGSLD